MAATHRPAVPMRVVDVRAAKVLVGAAVDEAKNIDTQGPPPRLFSRLRAVESWLAAVSVCW